MLITMMHSKIHRATVTHSELHYNGSMGIDQNYLDQAGMIEGQQIDVLNVNTGARFTTYALNEPRGSRRFGIYGAAAHLANPGDVVIVIAYALMEPAEARAYRPTVLIMDKDNNVATELHKDIEE
ncbi:MAG: aspartate 1-decarboxylase [Rickettsiales bacterium]|nr:aspartate 1-decarboxylase [Rickettsiales bacterium]